MPVQGLNEQLSDISESISRVVPELILSLAILFLLTAGLFRRKYHHFFPVVTILAAAASFIIIISGSLQHDLELFSGMIRRDGLADFLMLIVDVSVLLTCLITKGRRQRKVSEYYALILTVALGGHLLLMSANFVMVLLSLELVSISSYVLAGYSFNRAGAEGSLKYFLFGAIATAITLYGFSLLYGLTGTLDFTTQQFFDGIAAQRSPLLLIAGLMALAGFLFKIAATPMHPWAPDVYEAAPMPIVAYFSVAPKIAGLGILAKFLLAMQIKGQEHFDWQLIVAAIAILTIAVGNFSALWQKNPKRMMAYSSIAQSGFLLVGIAAFLPEGIHFMLFYAAAYMLMNFSVFAYLAYFEDRGAVLMPTFSGAGKVHIAAAAGLTISLVSLAGLPPTGGFTAKLLIFSGLWEAWLATDKTLLLWLLIFGLLNTVISLFYYLRIPYYAFIKAGEANSGEKRAGLENLLGLILVLVIVVIFFIPGVLMGLINRINFAF